MFLLINLDNQISSVGLFIGKQNLLLYYCLSMGSKLNLNIVNLSFEQKMWYVSEFRTLVTYKPLLKGVCVCFKQK